MSTDIRPSNVTSADCVVCGIDFNESDVVRVSVAKIGAEPVFACAGVCADRVPCPVCGVAAVSAASTNDDVVTAPRFTTPWQRIRGLANAADIDVYEIPSEECGDDFAGAVSVGFDVEGQIHGQIGLADDLDEDLCTDVLAFAIALYVGETDRITSTRSGALAIGRERLPGARSGAGHLAWHFVRSCGRDTPSATFDFVDLDGTAAEGSY